MDQCRACGQVYQTNHSCPEAPTTWDALQDVKVLIEHVESFSNDSWNEMLKHKIKMAKTALNNIAVQLGEGEVIFRRPSPHPPVDDSDPFEDPADALADRAEAEVEFWADNGQTYFDRPGYRP